MQGLPTSGNECRRTHPIEQIEEALRGGLIRKESQLAALRHVSEYFHGAAQVRIGVPGRGQPGQGEVSRAREGSARW
jgi:hypothetical protein